MRLILSWRETVVLLGLFCSLRRRFRLLWRGVNVVKKGCRFCVV